MAARVGEGTVLEDSGSVFMARARLASGAYITQAAISTITYRVWDINPTTYTEITAGAQTLVVASVVFDALQTAFPWTKDETGYNFKHEMPAASFPNGKGPYRVEYKVTPVSGQPFFMLFKVAAIEVLTS